MMIHLSRLRREETRSYVRRLTLRKPPGPPGEEWPDADAQGWASRYWKRDDLRNRWRYLRA